MTNPLAHPTVQLNNGVSMPQIGCGVFRVADAEPVIAAALDTGYRLFDTAHSYENEASVGKAIRDSGVDPRSLFVTTKLANSDQGYERAMRAFEQSLALLQLPAVDLYLIHWPVPARDLYVETWQAFEQIYASGRARAVGVCNFNAEHLHRLVDNSDLTPAVNQVELHPGFPQLGLRAVHAALGITTEAWSPLGRGSALLDRPEVTAIAEEVERTPAQVVLRWHLDEGHVVIPKSTNPKRLQSNLEVFDFTLSDAQRSVLSELPEPGRVGPDPLLFDEH
ncbi:MAG: 2,5-diketo-D-gluconate reductase [Pseudonocardiales bacterium]|nr:2,5-diketo-D-gluconate reductase [Pseudonocardiales bacterium]